MSKKRYTKIVHEGDYVAQVEVELIYSDEGWSPYLSPIYSPTRWFFAGAIPVLSCK